MHTITVTLKDATIARQAEEITSLRAELLAATPEEDAATRLRLGLRVSRLEEENRRLRDENRAMAREIALRISEAGQDRVAIDGLCANILALSNENASLRDTLEGWADAGHHNAALKAQPRG